MKVETIYTAFDGETFRDEQECLKHEESIRESYVISLHARLQKMKSGYLAELHNDYVKAKNNYTQVCTQKVSREKQVRVTQVYLNKKNIYEQALVEFKRLQKKFRSFKDNPNQEIIVL